MKKDNLCQDIILNFLNNKKLHIEIFKIIDSTNTYGKELFNNKKVNIDSLILAEEQSAGRGRLGRSFHSSNGKGIYMSLLLPNEISINSSSLLTVKVAVALCRSINKLTPFNSKIKWVNDIFINNKKIAGILVEGNSNFELGTMKDIVIGIGINFDSCNFPESLKNIADSLFNDIRINTFSLTREELIAHTINEIFSIIDSKNDNTLDIIHEYKSYSNVLGKEVTVHISNQEPFQGIAIDITDTGNLVIEKNTTKEIVTLSFGEVSIRF